MMELYPEKTTNRFQNSCFIILSNFLFVIAIIGYILPIADVDDGIGCES